MKKIAAYLTVILSLTFVFSAAALAADGGANVAGNWEMSMQGRNRTMTQTLAIQQDGNKISGTIKGRRGDMPFEGTVDGNKISFTVKRSTPRGDMTLEYSATVDGDTMTGTVKTRMGERPWTAKRSK